MNFKTAGTRKEHFNSAHRLHNPMWFNEKNKDIFGKCNNPNYHGHNYDLEVTVVGYVDEVTGHLIDTKYFTNLIKDNVLEKFDLKNFIKPIDGVVEMEGIIDYKVPFRFLGRLSSPNFGKTKAYINFQL